LKFFDLFAGIGGFRLGLERVGFECVGSCEIDSYCEQVYSKNFGEGYEYHDARQLDASTIQDFDILTAGFPCQAFSYAGKRMGFADTRGTLFLEIARIAEQKRPKILFLENVRGLLSHDRGRTFGTIINRLYELGYDIEWQVINGKYFVPQNRPRVYIIGHLRDRSSRPIFPLQEVDGVSDQTCGETCQSGERLWHTHTIDSNYWKGGGIRTMIMLRHTEANMRERIQLRDYTWNLELDSSKIGVFEGDKIRKLTPLECERLMGFPDGWTEGVSDTQRYKMLGNSVIVPVIEYIGRNIS